MKDGLFSVATVTPDLHLGDCIYNAAQTVHWMQEAEKAEVRILVFPELNLTGYSCGDLFLQQTLLTGAKTALREVQQASANLHLLSVVGLPLLVDGLLYNCAAVVHKGKILGFIPKTNLPNYGEFSEKRHFSPAPAAGKSIVWEGETVPFGTDILFACAELPELVLGVEICEDLWVPQTPSTALCAAGATVIVNPAATNEGVGKTAFRRRLVESTSARLLCGYLLACAGIGESTTDTVTGGHTLIAENGVLLAEQHFTEGLCQTELDVQLLMAERRRMQSYATADKPSVRTVSFHLPWTETKLTRFIEPSPFISSDPAIRKTNNAEILDIAAYGLARRLSHTHSACAVVGLSGGLDSTLAILTVYRAMQLLHRPATDILAVTMPCFGTTSRTKNNAVTLAECLGARLKTVTIGDSVMSHFQDIGHDPSVRNVTYENAQARERTQVLMDLANDENGLVIGTGDLSELALGWATYNGDHMSMYGVNGSIPKTLVRELVSHIAEEHTNTLLAETLRDILDTPVSPELLPAVEGQIAQKTEDLVGPYELHDFFLGYMLQYGFSPAKIYRLACHVWGKTYDEATIKHWLRTFFRRFFIQQFKRSCLPDGAKVGLSLSPRGGWQMPSDALSTLWLAEIDQL